MEVRGRVINYLMKLLPSLSVSDRLFSRFKFYRRMRGGAWYKVSDRIVPKRSYWVREVVNPKAYYVWKREVH